VLRCRGQGGVSGRGVAVPDVATSGGLGGVLRGGGLEWSGWRSCEDFPDDGGVGLC
jgi:hypothetical protein